jgi:hypothetical protein
MTFNTHTVAQKLSVSKDLQFCKKLFTKPTFKSFTKIVRSMLKNRENGKLSVLSMDVGKCISSISYFFNDAKWDTTELKQRIQQHLLKSEGTKIRDGDIASVDGSSISKKGDTFEFIGDVWDNADKCVKSGYEMIAIAIVSPVQKTRRLFDWLICSNQHPKFLSQPLYVHRLLKRFFEKAKQVTTFVFDSGFKNKYTMNYVLSEGKNFVIRVQADMVLWETGNVGKKGHGHRFNKIHKMGEANEHTLEINGKKGWKVTWVRGIVNAWMSEIKVPLTVLVIKNPVFRNPLILVTNLEPCTFLEAFEVYETYLHRWKIEQIFQSIKELGLEKFRVRKYKAIIRYLTIMFVVHSLLTWQTEYLQTRIKLRALMKKLLKKKRKIQDVLIGGVKIFYELYLQKTIKLKDLFAYEIS